MINIDINLSISVELDQFVLSGGMTFGTQIHQILQNFIIGILVPVTNEHLGDDLFHEAKSQVSPSEYLILFLK